MKPDIMTDHAPSPVADYSDADIFCVEAQGHSFTFYPRGSDRLDALLKHIAEARETLSVFYYTFHDDPVGERVRDALVEAARRGVDVHLIVDDFGSDAPKSFFEPITDAGGRFSVFSASWSVRYLVRNHQKFVIVDEKQVFTGGSNISESYYNPPDCNGWCDLGVTIEGRVVEDFCRWFKLLHEWTETSGSHLRRVRRLIRDWDPGEGPVQLLLGGPLVRRSHWVFRFKRDLRGAKRLDLVTAYFAPPLSVRRQIARLARRGRARLITAGKSDIGASIGIARRLYRRLLRAGARRFEFQPCKLHMKLLVVDDTSYFGSANCDRRSMRINVELMVRVEDEQLAARLRELIDNLEQGTQPIDLDWYRENTNVFTRLRWRIFYLLNMADYGMARMASPEE